MPDFTDQPYFETTRRIAPPPDAECWAERIGRRAWLAHNPRGSSVLMADEANGLPNAFSPGELLKLALAGCAGLTAEGPVGRRLGEDYPATIVVRTTKHPDEDRYETFDEQVLLDTAELDETARAGLVAAMSRAIARGCTVGLTLQGDVTVTSHLDDATATAITQLPAE